MDALPFHMNGAYTGPFWAVVSAAIFGLTHVALRRGLDSLEVLPALVIEVTVALFTVGIVAILVEGFEVLRVATWSAVLFLSAAGIMHFFLGWGFMGASTQLIGAARMSAMASISPLFATFLAVVALDEELNLFITLGMFLIIAGIWLTLRE